jgi:tetratricopeptide (TPR) repeat protein
MTEQYINPDPKSAEDYNNIGLDKYCLGFEEEAIKDFDQAIALDPSFAYAYGNRGNAKYRLGHQDAAIEDMKIMIELFRQQGRMDLCQIAIDTIKRIQEYGLKRGL